MPTYRVRLRTYLGILSVEDVEAVNEDEAFDKAVEEAKKELDCAKIDEITEIKN